MEDALAFSFPEREITTDCRALDRAFGISGLGGFCYGQKQKVSYLHEIAGLNLVK